LAIYRYRNQVPRLENAAFIAESADLIGEIHVGAGASVWFGARIRADNAPITLGARCNIQENAVLHTDVGIPLIVGDNVTVGHGATLHGCEIGEASLIGIGAVILNHAQIGANSLVGAGALITERKRFPAGSLIMGSPARVVRALKASEIEALANSAQQYWFKAQAMQTDLVRLAVHAPDDADGRLWQGA